MSVISIINLNNARIRTSFWVNVKKKRKSLFNNPDDVIIIGLCALWVRSSRTLQHCQESATTTLKRNSDVSLTVAHASPPSLPCRLGRPPIHHNTIAASASATNIPELRYILTALPPCPTLTLNTLPGVTATSSTLL